jgi:hypothetical protein
MVSQVYLCLCKVFEKIDLRLDLRPACGVKDERPVFGRGPTFSLSFYFNEWGITKMPHWVEIFLVASLSFCVASQLNLEVWWVWGLDMRFLGRKRMKNKRSGNEFMYGPPGRRCAKVKAISISAMGSSG